MTDTPIDPEFFIRCAVCGGKLTRDAEYCLGEEWVHDDDVITLRGTGTVVAWTIYDHEAAPAVIDPEKKFQLSLVSGDRIGYVDTRPIEAVARDGDAALSQPQQHTQEQYPDGTSPRTGDPGQAHHRIPHRQR